jgi:hypothetical protein
MSSIRNDIIIIISFLCTYVLAYSLPLANGQQLNVTEVNVNGTIFYSTSGNSTTIQLDGRNCEYFVSLEDNPVCMVYDEKYPFNDGYCNMLNSEESRYCANPALIEEDRQAQVDQNKLSELWNLCDKLTGFPPEAPEGSTWEETQCRLPEGYRIPVENAFELRDKLNAMGGIDSLTRQEIIEVVSNLSVAN